MGGVFSGKRPFGCSVGRDWSTYMVKLPKNLIPLSVQSACRRVLFLSRSICQDNKQCVKGGVNRSCCSIQPRETCCTAAIRVASSTRPPKATRTNKIVLTIWMIRMNFNLKHFWRKNVFYLVDAHFVAFDQLEGHGKRAFFCKTSLQAARLEVISICETFVQISFWLNFISISVYRYISSYPRAEG